MEVVALAGAALIVCEAFWISYGVFARYVMRDPDPYVTEATALLLVPLAFLGMGHAIAADAMPAVTGIVNRTGPMVRCALSKVSLLTMASISAFYFTTAAIAAFRTFESRASTPILQWPEFPFWVAVAIGTGLATLYCILCLFSGPSPQSSKGVS